MASHPTQHRADGSFPSPTSSPPLPPLPSVRYPSSSPERTSNAQHKQAGVYGLPTPPMDSGDRFAETTALINSADGNFQQYQGKRGVKILNKAGDTLSVIQTDVATVQSYASPLQVAMDSEPVKAIRQSITALVDGLPSLLKVLDDVAQVHPFIKVAVGAFRVAIELDLKRKDNDKKISLLFVEMRDMMAVLIQLRDIDRDKRVGEDSLTIQDRMEKLVVKTEQDIRKCANACSAYAKKRTISKVLQSSSWGDTFKGFIQGFTTRRGEFEFELSMYIGRAVNTANDRLVTLDEKMNRLLVYFEACASSEEQYLTRLVREKGGPQAVMGNEKLLRKIYEDKGAAGAFSRPAERRVGGRHEVGDEFKEVLQELKVDTETAIRENFAHFERKFVIQQRELEEEMRRAMHREGDRIIESVTSGPHDRIIDPDIHEIWKEMRWRGNVKARHFVLALRDYFREKLDHLKHVKSGSTPIATTRQISEQDEWALEYINITRLQPIIEAFDDDASGFITVSEVNAFTTARPDDWSLLHWLAYWAIGYQMTMSDYAAKIDIILAKMFSLKNYVLPANRNMVEKYLHVVWESVTLFTAAFRRIPCDDSLMNRFESYTKAEESRLRRNLETARYDFDTLDTLELVRGPGRIEKHLLPLLHLLLSRDFEIMRLARTRLLHVDELFDAEDTIEWVFVAAYERCTDLSDIFKQQKLDPDQQFKIFGFEIYKYMHNESDLTSMKSLKESKFVEHEYDDDEEAQDVDPASIINYPLDTVQELLVAREWVASDDDEQADPAVQAVLGTWSGFCIWEERYPCQSMIPLDLHTSSSSPQKFRCTGAAANGTNWTLTGECIVDPESGKTEYTFNITYAARYATQSFRGALEQNETALCGSWGYGADTENRPHSFVFKRLPPKLMRYWPSPTEFAQNRSRALWKFACAAVLSQVQHRMHSWRALEQRWRTGQRFVELVLHSEFSGLSREELLDLSRCQRNMTPSEARLYQMFKDMRERSITVHFGIGCDVCQDLIRGGRIMCLSCGTKTTIDLCDKPKCYSQQVDTEQRDDLTTPHLPSHDVFKVRTAIHQLREFGNAHRAAQSALKAARQIFANAVEPKAAESDPAASVGSPSKKPACVKCSAQVSQPCWYCIECKGSNEDVFICSQCDTTHAGFTQGKHKAVHALVRVQPFDPAAAAASERAFLDARMHALEGGLHEVRYRLEQSFGAVEDKIDVVQGRLGGDIAQLKARVTALGERLLRIENLLVGIGERVLGGGIAGAGDEPVPARMAAVRQQTWPGAQTMVVGQRSEESEFSVWVRQMRGSV